MKVNTNLVQKAKSSKRLLIHKGNQIFHICGECRDIERNGIEFRLNKKQIPVSKKYPHVMSCSQRGRF
jgi:hypothetical protein